MAPGDKPWGAFAISNSVAGKSGKYGKFPADIYRSIFNFDPLVRSDYFPYLPYLPAAVRGLDRPHDQVVCTRCSVPLGVEGKSIAAGALHPSRPITEDLRGYVLRAENIL